MSEKLNQSFSSVHSWSADSIMPSRTHGRATTKSKDKTARTEATFPLPQWPLLRPLAPTADLCLQPLLNDQIFVIRNLFTSTLCKTYVAFLSTLPLSTTPAQPQHGDAVRVNDPIQFEDPRIAEILWKATGLASLINRPLPEDESGLCRPANGVWGGEVVGLNPRIRIYRYKEGQFFAQHCRCTRLSFATTCCMTGAPRSSISRSAIGSYLRFTFGKWLKNSMADNPGTGFHVYINVIATMMLFLLYTLFQFLHQRVSRLT